MRSFKRHTTSEVYEALDLDPRQIEKIHLAAEWPNPPGSTLISNNLQELVQKYFGLKDNNQERGGNIQAIPDDKLIYTSEQSPRCSVPQDEMTIEMSHSAHDDRVGQWSPISEAPSPIKFPEEDHCVHDELETKPLESNSSDSKQWAHSKQAFLGWTLKSEDLPGTDRLDLNPAPYHSTVLLSLTSSEPFHGIKRQANETPITAHVESAVRLTCKVEQDLGRSSSANNLCDSIPDVSVPEANSEGCYLPKVETESYWIKEDVDSPVLVDWDDGSEVEEIYDERSFRSTGLEDRSYVCPARLQKLMAQTAPEQV